jgi:hypothetical protein
VAEVLRAEDPASLRGVYAGAARAVHWVRPQAQRRAAMQAVPAALPMRVVLQGIAGELETELTMWAREVDAPGLRDIYAAAAQVLGALARVTGPQPLHLRLDRIEEQMCRLFHVDRVGMRVLCTLAGAGTEYLPDTACDRRLLGTGSNAAVLDWSAVCHVPAGDVLAFKGSPREVGESFPRGGLIHRSPPASPSQPRCLLAIDCELPLPGAGQAGASS